MFDKLDSTELTYSRLSEELSKGGIDYSSKGYLDLLKKHKTLEKTVLLYRQYKDVNKSIEDAKEFLSSSKDSEFLSLAKEELTELRLKQAVLIDELKLSLFPKDPNSDKNVIMEIRAGTGGDEAALFAADLYRMYFKYAENSGWKIELLSSSPIEVGGYKEIIFSVTGTDVYSKLKFEMGGHRVQRIPVTESGGRIHTSAVTVAVLPEVEEEDIEINPSDLRIDVFRSSGPGGQSVNTTDSAVRITHMPSGITVQCQDEKSQHKNKAKAMRVLRARVQESLEEERNKELKEERKLQIGSGDRSERIRTYNFPQNRMTDHRVNFSVYNKLDNLLNGEIEEFTNKLMQSEKEEILKNFL